MKQVNVAIIDSGIQLNALCESARNNTQNGYIINGGTVLSIAGIKRDRLEDVEGDKNRKSQMFEIQTSEIF